MRRRGAGRRATFFVLAFFFAGAARFAFAAFAGFDRFAFAVFRAALATLSDLLVRFLVAMTIPDERQGECYGM